MKEWNNWMRIAVKRKNTRVIRLLWWLSDLEFDARSCPARKFFVSDMLNEWKQTEEVIKVRQRFGV